jgi:HlyD family secretion protein
VLSFSVIKYTKKPTAGSRGEHLTDEVLMMQLQGKKKFQTGVRSLVWSGVLALVSAGGWLVYVKTLNRSAESVAVRLLTVKQGDVEIVINESGTVELAAQQALKSPGDVTVDRVLVNVGDRVRFGQQLVILRNKEGQDKLADQELKIRKQELILARSRQKVQEAQEKLAAAQKELQEPVSKQLAIRKQELILARSRQKVQEAQEKLKAVQQELQQDEALAQKGFIAGMELQAQKEKVRDAESNLREAESTVSTATVDLQSLQAEQQRPQELQNKVMQAQSELQQARSDVNTNSRDLQVLQVERQSIQQQLQNNVVSAPIPGKVLDIKVKDGDGVKIGEDLLALGNPAQELVKLQLSTLDAAKVRVNQKARIKVIGPNAQPFTGQVKSLYPQAIAPDKNDNPFSGQSGQVKVPATVQLDQPSGTLIPGSQVSVEIIQDQRQNVVVLDLAAIQHSKSGAFVWIRDSQGKAQKRTITLGLEAVTTVEVKSGLRPGEQVVLPETPLQPGMPVTPTSSPKRANRKTPSLP